MSNRAERHGSASRLSQDPRPLLTTSLRAWASRAGFGMTAFGVLGFGLVQGMTPPIPIQVDIVFWTVSLAILPASLSLFSFATFLSLSGVILFVGLRRDDTPTAVPDHGPQVDAIVPVYRDDRVLHRSVQSLLASDYEDLDVHIVCEPDDDASIERARELAAHDRVHCLVNTGAPGSKAGAINVATERTDGEYLAVFDADERVDPTFVPTAADRLPRCDVVQGRTVPQPNGMIESIGYYESVLLGKLTHRLLGLVTGFRMAASRAVVMRRDAFERVDGYDPSMLTEDFDFAVRCYDAGLDVREVFDCPSRIDAAHSLSDWWGQRKRWMTGYAQVLHQRSGSLRPRIRSVLAFGVAAGTVLGNLLMLSLVSKVAILAVIGAGYALAVPLVTVAGIALAVRLYDLKHGQVTDVGIGWLLAPLVLPIYSLAGIKGIVEYCVSWDGEWYYVVKDA